MLKVPNVGEIELLEWALKATTTPEDLNLKLYTNDYTPVDASVTGDFTEATFTNYTAKTLSRGSWNDATTVGGKAQIDYNAVQSWTAGSTETIYGYYIVGATSNTLIFAERFDAEATLNNGDILNITLVITTNSEN